MSLKRAAALNRKLLEAVRAWDIAAEWDDVVRYFYYFDDVSAVESGQVLAVIGHKGEGKSAIARWIDNINNPNRKGRCARLSLKDFDAGELYTFADTKRGLQNQYVTLWSYIIICAVCRSMINDHSVDPQQVHYLKKRFKKEFSSDSFELGSILEKGAGFSILGTGLSWGGLGGKSPRAQIRRFRKTIGKFIDELRHVQIEKPYYVIFDELDDDYNDVIRNSEGFENYRNLIIGLLRAIDRLSREFKELERPIHPVMMLRKDIYEVIPFNDKGKFARQIRDISWARPRLHRLLAFRIARADNPDVDPKDVGQFHDEWSKLFDTDDFDRRSCDIERLFNYIFTRTFLRPRDFISFLHHASSVAYDRDSNTGISVKDVVEAEAAYSKYLRQEIEDAITGIHPEFAQIINVISDLRKRMFTYSELETALETRMTPRMKELMSTKGVIDLLYYFNVVGRHSEKFHGSFGFQRSGERVNEDWEFVVHRGLWREFGLTNGGLPELVGAIRKRA
jgi:energy-coupling factor transporter ATP-binding protein EcfA2